MYWNLFNKVCGFYKMASFGLDSNLEYVELLLDSEDASFPNNGSVKKENWPVFQLARPITNVAGIKILEAQIPFTFYVFDNSRVSTYVQFEEYGKGSTGFYIPDGNYTAASLAATLQTLLHDASVNIGMPHNNYTVTISTTNNTTPYTGKMTITASAGDFKISFLSSNPNENIGALLGFPTETGVPYDYSSFNSVLVSPSFNQITGPNYLYVNSVALGTLCNTYLPAGATDLGAGTQFPQVTKIPVNVQPGGVIYWSDPSPDFYYSLENLLNLNQFDFYLTLGNTNGLLDLNGVPFSLKLGVLINKQVRSEFVGSNIQGNRVLTRNY